MAAHTSQVNTYSLDPCVGVGTPLNNNQYNWPQQKQIINRVHSNIVKNASLHKWFYKKRGKSSRDLTLHR